MGVPSPASTEFLGAAFKRDPVRAGRVLLARHATWHHHRAGLPGPCVPQVPAHPCHAPSRKSRHPRNLMQKIPRQLKKETVRQGGELLHEALSPLTRHGIL